MEELLKRVDPKHRTLDKFFQEELAKPLGKTPKPLCSSYECTKSQGRTVSCVVPVRVPHPKAWTGKEGYLMTPWKMCWRYKETTDACFILLLFRSWCADRTSLLGKLSRCWVEVNIILQPWRLECFLLWRGFEGDNQRDYRTGNGRQNDERREGTNCGQWFGSCFGDCMNHGFRHPLLKYLPCGAYGRTWVENAHNTTHTLHFCQTKPWDTQFSANQLCKSYRIDFICGYSPFLHERLSSSEKRTCFVMCLSACLSFFLSFYLCLSAQQKILTNKKALFSARRGMPLWVRTYVRHPPPVSVATAEQDTWLSWWVSWLLEDPIKER